MSSTGRRANRALGVVLVRDRRAEDGHYGVSYELLDRAPEPLEVGLDALVVRTQRRANVLGVGAIRPVGEPDEVDEEHGDDLPLLPGRRFDDEQLPALRQNRARSGFSSPQCGQTSTRGSLQRLEVTSTCTAALICPAPPCIGCGFVSVRKITSQRRTSGAVGLTVAEVGSPVLSERISAAPPEPH